LRFIFIFFCLISSLINVAQNSVWLNHFGGHNNDKVTKLEFNKTGYLFAAGDIKYTVDFKNGSFDSTLDASNGNCFLTKIDPSSGMPIWVRQFGKGGQAYIRSFTFDNDNNIFLAGMFAGTVDFDPSAKVKELTSNGPQSDIFIMKLDSSGNLNWVKSIGNTSTDWVTSITIDSYANIYFSGRYNFTIDFNPDSIVNNLTTNHNPDGYVCKFDSSGNFEFVRNFPGYNYQSCNDLVYDNNGFLFVLGTFEINLITKPKKKVIRSNGEKDIFISKIDTSGNRYWTRQIGGTSDEYGTDILLDQNRNIYITGDFKGKSDLDPSSNHYFLNAINSHPSLYDSFVAKYDKDGWFKWANGYGGKSFERSYAIALDNQHNIYNTAYFSDTATFSNNNNLSFVAIGHGDFLLNKFDSLGTHIYTRHFIGSSDAVAFTLAIDTVSNIYLAGTFRDSVDFEPGPLSLNKTSKNMYDLFIQKLNQNPISVNIVELKDAQKVNLYPNPTRRGVNIQLQELINLIDIKVYDMNTSLIANYQWENQNFIQFELDVPKGIYLLELNLNNEKPQYLKVIKQ